MVRFPAPRLAERLLVRSGVTRFARRRRRGRTLVLAYHNVVPDQDAGRGDTSLHLPMGRFRRQLDWIERTFEVVSLRSVLEEAGRPRRRPRLALTFDDAYAGAIRLALPELRRRGLPSAVFVTPACLGDRAFWWDEIDLHQRPGSAMPVRERALGELRGEKERIRAWASESGCTIRSVPELYRPATREELRAATTGTDVAIASHTWTHPNLTRLPDPRLEEELRRPIEWLRQRFDAFLPWLTYPYGLSDARVRRMAERVGYERAMMIEGGWIEAGSDPFALPRLNVPAGITMAGLEVRAAGFGST